MRTELEGQQRFIYSFHFFLFTDCIEALEGMKEWARDSQGAGTAHACCVRCYHERAKTHNLGDWQLP